MTAIAPKRLTDSQRDLLAAIRAVGTITTAQAFVFYASPSDALARLERLGLVRRVKRGYWAALHD